MEITLDDHALKTLARRLEDALQDAADDPDGGWDVEVCEALADSLGDAVQAHVARRGDVGLRERLFEVVHAWEGGTLSVLLRTVAFELGDVGVDVGWSRAAVDAIDRASNHSHGEVVDDLDEGDVEA